MLIATSMDWTMAIAERIRSSIEKTEFRNITVGIGLCECRDDLDLEEFVKSADDALYTVKHAGGNRVHRNVS